MDRRDAGYGFKFLAPAAAIPAAHRAAFRTFYDYLGDHSGEPSRTKPSQAQAIAAAREMRQWIQTCRSQH